VKQVFTAAVFHQPFLRQAVLLIAAVAITAVPAFAETADSEAFFENRIRPVLASHCYKCHSSKAGVAKGGLVLDTAAGLLQGGESGPVIAPGSPADSLLIDALLYDGPEMPPEGRLAESVIADFTRWIAAGAADPRPLTAIPKRPSTTPTTSDHWAFQPITDHTVPTVKQKDWPADPLDAFILARLETAGLAPTAPADRPTLIRRLTFDLTGLPPTPKEVADFVDDPSPQAIPKLVDRLLASKQFGVYWGRHWLDVARYADSNGGDFNATFHDAWRYRDYVIDSFNEDKPFNHFIREQVAGDLLPASNQQQRAEQLIATGFLMIGTKMLSERDKEKLLLDVADEQVGAIGSAIMGMTLGCARCHDHKFDPISTADYHAVAGIFTSTETLRGESQRYVSTWPRRELPTPHEHREAVANHTARKNKIETAIKTAREQLAGHERQLQNLEDGRLTLTVDNSEARLTGSWKSSNYFPNFIGSDYLHDEKSEKGKKFAEFSFLVPASGQYEVLLSYTPGSNRAANVPVSIRHAEGEVEVTVDQRPNPPIDNRFVSLGLFPFSHAAKAGLTIATRDTEGYVIVDAVRLRADSSVAMPPDVAAAGTKELVDRVAADRSTVERLEAELKALQQDAPPPLPTAFAVGDAAKIADTAIRIRGEPQNHGAVIPRGVIRTISATPQPTFPKDTSGRVQLADWLVDPNHPLTSRVYVNRIWHHLIGCGIVASVDNFGLRGDRPSHPDLLDFLTLRFREGGWSTKTLIRRIVLSATYRQSSQFDHDSWQEDPDNRLLWRANRRRLPAEAIRDAMLSVAGHLDLSPAESPVSGLGTLVTQNTSEEKPYERQGSSNRSVYLPIIRSELPDILSIFDFADPDTVTGRRAETNVPTQPLFLLNSSFVAEQAQRTANRILDQQPDSAADVIERCFILLLARKPTASERTVAEDFLAERGATPTTVADLVQALFASTPFRLLD
jgi:mono/diheme cytochrome c family protein